MTLADDLAATLAQLVNDLSGYKNCPAIRKMTAPARAALARYDQEQAANRATGWLEDNYTDIYVEWLEAQRPTFEIWLQERHPDVWAEYVRERQ